MHFRRHVTIRIEISARKRRNSYAANASNAVEIMRCVVFCERTTKRNAYRNCKRYALHTTTSIRARRRRFASNKSPICDRVNNLSRAVSLRYARSCSDDMGEDGAFLSSNIGNDGRDICMRCLCGVRRIVDAARRRVSACKIV